MANEITQENQNVESDGELKKQLLELGQEGSEKPKDEAQSRVRTSVEVDEEQSLSDEAEQSVVNQTGPQLDLQGEGSKKLIIGQVTKMCGSPTVESGDAGAIALLEQGDPVYAGDQIYNPGGTLTEITLTNGQVILLSDNHAFSANAIATAGGLDIPNAFVFSSGPLSSYPQVYAYSDEQVGLFNTSLAGPDGLFFTPPVFPSTTGLVGTLPAGGGGLPGIVSSGFPLTVIPTLGVIPTTIAPDSSFLIEAIGSVQLRNTAATPSVANNLQVELDGATIAGFTFNPGVAALLVPAGGALYIANNGDWFVYTAGGAVVNAGNQAGLNWSFTDTNGDSRVDTRDRVGVNLKTDATTVIDTFLANGASFGTQLWTPGPAVPAAALALLGAFISHETFSGQAGDQLAVMDALGLTRLDLDNIIEATPNNDNVFFVRNASADSDTALDWTTTNVLTPGLPASQPSPNPQDVFNDDFDPNAPNPSALAGQSIFVGTGGADVLAAGAGNDLLLGEGGNDDLQGEANNDIILGGAGNDKLDGGTGADVLIDGDGRDFLVGSEGNDILIGSNPALGQAAPGGDQGDALIGDIVHTGEELFTFNVVMVLDASRSMGAVATDLVTNVNAHGVLSTHNEFQIKGLPSGTVLESTGGFQEVVVAPGFYSQSMTKTQLDNLSIQLPGSEFTGGATPGNFSVDIQGRASTLDPFQEFLGFSTAFGGTAAIISMREAAASLNLNLVQDGFDATTQVRIVSFDTSATVETFGFQTDFNPSDANLQTVINNITPVGEADFEVGLQEAVNHLTTVTGTDIIYFFSDGNDFNTFAPLPSLTTAITANNIDVYSFGTSVDALNSNVNLTELQAVANLGEFSTSASLTIVNPTTAASLVDDPTDSIIEVQRLGSDVLIGGDEADAIFGDAMLVDFTQISVNSATPVATLIANFNADPVTFVSTHLINSTFDNALSSLGLEDFIEAGGGDDVVFGQGGNDEISGGAGNDILIGGRGDDLIDAGNQNDGEQDLILILRSLDGNDRIDGFDNVGAVHDVVSLDALFDTLGTASGAARVADVVLTQVTSDVVLTINGVPNFSLRFENSSANTVADFSVGNAPGDDIFVG